MEHAVQARGDRAPTLGSAGWRVLQHYKYIYAGGIVWQITRTTRYPADCLGPCTPNGLVNPNQTAAQFNVPLGASQYRLLGSNQATRYHGWEMDHHRQTAVQPEFSLFNALNNRAAYTVRSMNYLTSSFMQPSLVLQPRLARLGVQLKW